MPRNVPAWARRVAQRLPVTREYERRLVELHQQLRERDLEVNHYRWIASRYDRGWPPGHFYSPIADLDDIRRRRLSLFGLDPLDIPGVNLDLAGQWKRADELAPLVATQPFTDAAQPGLRYRFDNPAYANTDGLFLHLVLRHNEPRRLIEVGSGWSSACTLDTVERFLDWRTAITFVEPYDELLRSVMAPGDEARVEILAMGVQDVPLARFEALEAGDVCFIDSTHVAKIGSDVVHELFRILPALAPGVLIHLHDVFPAFEYPEQWIEEGRAWNELYLLRAFLQYNEAFEILVWPGLLAHDDPDRFFAAFPMARANLGGSIWLRRVH